MPGPEVWHAMEGLWDTHHLAGGRHRMQCACSAAGLGWGRRGKGWGLERTVRKGILGWRSNRSKEFEAGRIW